MPQVFRALQCFKCHTFQVQQVKKAKTWACTMCTAKQSVLKIYTEGAAKECRSVVQQLNFRRGSAKDTEYGATEPASERVHDGEETYVQDYGEYTDDHSHEGHFSAVTMQQCTNTSNAEINQRGECNRWDAFLEKEDVDDAFGHVGTLCVSLHILVQCRCIATYQKEIELPCP
eukprot:m.79426 g.79426  ORF g.79426 m.79426 type:complete len:173 (+) comp16271_c0_seq1:252-770(+)